MGSGSARKFTGALLLVTFAASTMLAESNVAMLYTSGTAAVNGAAAGRSSSVFSGDEIQTGVSGATITASGSTVNVPANSSVVFEGKTVAVDVGGVQINTSQGMAARVSAFTVSPAENGSAKFNVAKLDGKFMVSAERGAVLISNGDSSTVVQEGQSKTTEDAPPSPEQSQKKKDKRKPAGAPVPAGGQTMGGLSSTALWGIAGAATVAGVVLAIETTGPPESPSRRDH